MACKPQKLIFHSSGGLEVRDQGASRFNIGGGSFPDLVDGHLLTVSSHGKKGETISWNLFYKDTNSIHEGSVLMI